MTDGDALLAAILANPEEDTPRLVYADWLQENGQPERAEFIRVQCELARRDLMLPPLASLPSHICTDCNALWILWSGDAGWSLCSAACGACCDNAPMTGPNIRPITLEEQNLLRRERQLLDRLDRFIPDDGVRLDLSAVPVWRRGFLAELTCSAADWLAHADALCWHPKQTVRCPEKGCVDGVIGRPPRGGAGGQWMGRMCDTCDGEGTVSRPCPPTAQPIRRVRLTTWPGQTPGWPRLTLTLVTPDGEGYVYEPWPGVVFKLPAQDGQVLTATADGPRWTDPDPEPLPLDGWRIEIYRHQPQEPGWYIDPPARADLTLRVELPPDVARPANDLPGTRVGPLAATDTFGRRWRVESAVVVDTVRFDASRGRREMVVTARSAGRIDPG